MKQFILVFSFLIYTVLYEGMIWVGGMYVILNYEWSAWWIVLMFLLSTGQIKPKTWRYLLIREDKKVCKESQKIIVP